MGQEPNLAHYPNPRLKSTLSSTSSVPATPAHRKLRRAAAQPSNNRTSSGPAARNRLETPVRSTNKIKLKKNAEKLTRPDAWLLSGLVSLPEQKKGLFPYN